MTSTSALFVHRMDDQLKSFKDLADGVGRLRGIMTRKVTELAEYFGEDEADCDTTSIFTVLQQFRRALKDSKASIERSRSLLKEPSNLASPAVQVWLKET